VADGRGLFVVSQFKIKVIDQKTKVKTEFDLMTSITNVFERNIYSVSIVYSKQEIQLSLWERPTVKPIVSGTAAVRLLPRRRR